MSYCLILSSVFRDDEKISVDEIKMLFNFIINTYYLNPVNWEETQMLFGFFNY